MHAIVGYAQVATPQIDPKADAILHQMSTALTAAKGMTFDVNSTADEVLPDGQVVQFARNQKITVRRPDRVATSVIGDREEMKFAYDGKQVVIYNITGNTWSSVDAPATIDQTMDMLANRYGMATPACGFSVFRPVQRFDRAAAKRHVPWHGLCARH